MTPLRPGDVVTLDIERPAAGGRMIARADGQVVLVAGAIPGERVSARVERIGKGVVFASAESIDRPSPDRRPVATDPQCGGGLYAHIDYDRQRALKAQVIADAFGRIGRLTLPGDLAVAGSREDGYRMRARLHMRSGRVGFFRESTHDICDARATRQLLPAASDAIERLAAVFRSLGVHAPLELDVSENVDASMRAVHVGAGRAPFDARVLRGTVPGGGLTGLSVDEQDVGGDPHVTDTLTVAGKAVMLRRHARAFFQGNRYLLGDLVSHIAAQVGAVRTVIDLYAGVGLFAIAAAVVSGGRVSAVEGDRFAARDLAFNAHAAAVPVTAVHQPVETFMAAAPRDADLVIVDPPRTGMSREALDGVIAVRARRMVYVSCDVATLARDARRIVDAGWQIARADAFDLFPNTPHVETVVMFERGSFRS